MSRLVKKEKTIFDLIQNGKDQFSMALPKHIPIDRFIRISMSALRTNPKLQKCSQASVMASLLTMSQLGLEPGVLGQCYLIPYGNECQFQISYKGMIELLRRTGQLKDIYAYTVKEKDEFSIEYGLHRDLKHIPNMNENSEVIGYYAVAILKDGTATFEFMTKLEVEAHGKRFSKAYNSTTSPWKSDFDEMAKKTVIKKLLKYLPVSAEILENVAKDEKTMEFNFDTKEILEKEDEIIEAEPVDVVDEETVNETTGEIIEDDPFGFE